VTHVGLDWSDEQGLVRGVACSGSIELIDGHELLAVSHDCACAVGLHILDVWWLNARGSAHLQKPAKRLRISVTAWCIADVHAKRILPDTLELITLQIWEGIARAAAWGEGEPQEALEEQKAKKSVEPPFAVCQDRTGDLRIMRPTL